MINKRRSHSQFQPVPPFRYLHPFFYGSPIFCLMVLWLVAGCSTSHQHAQSPGDVETTDRGAFSTTDEQIFVGDTIEMSYDPNVIMKRAESYFEKESYAEAIVEYKHFLDLHRNHVLAPYAQFKIGVSHFKQFKTVDRDPEPLNQTINAYNKLLDEFPGGRYQAEAQETIHRCRELLAQRHLMVGDFYLKREAYLAAANRYEKVIKEFPEFNMAGDAMFLLAKTYQNLGIEEWTQEWLIALINHYPNNSHHSKAQEQLAALQAEHPHLLAALTPNQTQREEVVHLSEPISTSLTHAGILPTSEMTQTAALQSSPTPSTSLSCAPGEWCESGISPKTQPKRRSPVTQSALVCKTGEWC
jgi:outer membrane protein assembly factor BamD